MKHYQFEITLPYNDELALEIISKLIESRTGFEYEFWWSFAPPHKFCIKFGRYSEEGKNKTKEWILTWPFFKDIVEGITIHEVD